MSDKEMSAEDFKKKLDADNVEFVDLRFTDPRGKMHHITYDAKNLSADNIAEGVMFDASSIAGWKSINDSDMLLSLDLSSAHSDPFYAQNTMVLFCDVLEPSTAQGYTRDPRYIARLAENWLTQSGIADTAYFGPEAEFFVFDDVRFSSTAYNSGFKLDSIELPSNCDREYEMGNLGHRPRLKGGYFPVNPVDSAQDMRSEMVNMINEMGVVCDKHHHEVAAAQHELGITFAPLKRSADSMQIYKYAVHNVANSYGKTATFMPKPVYGDNGTGMHCHQSLWKAGKPLFAGNRYADLSDMCLYYIGGIIKHARALNAFTNPTTNSYKRLVPGFEAPVLLAYSAQNRSAACRIPFANSPNAKRLEVRFPDPCANSYLAFAAMLMAGLDGIENKIHPGDAMDKNLYDLPPHELANIPQVCRSLREAVDHLKNGRDFLKKGNVFTDDFIDSYIELKNEDIIRYEQSPHPVEFDMYYSA